MINSTVQSPSPDVCSVWSWICMVFILAVRLQANYKRWQLPSEKALWCTLIKWVPPLARQKKLQGRHEAPSFQCIKFKSYVPSIWGAHTTVWIIRTWLPGTDLPVNLNTLIIYDKEQNIWPLSGWLEFGCRLSCTHFTCKSKCINYVWQRRKRLSLSGNLGYAGKWTFIYA